MLNAYQANAVSISKKRLYLAPKSNIDTLYVVSEESETQQCQIIINDTEITDNSIITFLPKGQVAANSTKKIIRYAPRQFDIAPRQFQNIKFSYRRRPGLADGEYKGLVAIRCTTKTTNDEGENILTVKPLLILNVPIIVHTGELEASADFDSVKLTEKHVEVKIKIAGKRAITGDLELVDNSSGEILSSKKEMSIYQESPIKQIILPLNKSVNAPMLIRFREIAKFGGSDLLIEQLVKPL